MKTHMDARGGVTLRGRFNVDIEGTPDETVAFLMSMAQNSGALRTDLLSLIERFSRTNEHPFVIVELSADDCTCNRKHRRFAVSTQGGTAREFAVRCDDPFTYPQDLIELVVAVVKMPAHLCSNCGNEHDSVALSLLDGEQVNLDALCGRSA